MLWTSDGRQNNVVFLLQSIDSLLNTRWSFFFYHLKQTSCVWLLSWNPISESQLALYVIYVHLSSRYTTYNYFKLRLICKQMIFETSNNVSYMHTSFINTKRNFFIHSNMAHSVFFSERKKTRDFYLWNTHKPPKRMKSIIEPGCSIFCFSPFL